jgi:hypothetical protein
MMGLRVLSFGRREQVANYVVVENLLQAVEIPKDGTLSRTIHRDDRVKIVLFGFAGGQELSQHTAAVPAIIEIVQGDARVTLDGDEKELSAAPGFSWTPIFRIPFMPAPTWSCF